MMNQPVAIVLGGTIPHKYLIKNLKNRGFYVILVDYYKNPPAAATADKHIRESTLDQEAVLAIAKRESASLVISGCVDQANLTACYVAEKLNLPAPYSYTTALRVTDKALMKAGMVKAGVPTAPYEVVAADKIGSYECSSFPKVVKPCDCNGSKGVQRVDHPEELHKALALACNLSRSRKAIVEEYLTGLEASYYFLLSGAEAIEIYSHLRSSERSNLTSSLGSFLFKGPVSTSKTLLGKLKDSVKKISKEFYLVDTPLVVQVKIDADEFNVIEFMPRLSGGISPMVVKDFFGYDLIDCVIDSYIGNKFCLPGRFEESIKVCTIHLYGKEGSLCHVDGADELVAGGIIDGYYVHKSPGMNMSCADLSSANRVLAVVFKYEADEELAERIKRMISGLSIMNTNGVDVFARNLLC